MADYRKLGLVPYAAECGAIANDKHQSSIADTSSVTDISSGCQPNDRPFRLEPWWMKGTAGNTILFVEHGRTPGELDERWPAIDLSEVEELSDFLRTVKEALDAAEQDVEAGVADVCMPKPLSAAPRSKQLERLRLAFFKQRVHAFHWC